VRLADVNSDGRLDALSANQGSGNISVLLGDGAGGLAPAPFSPVAAGAVGPTALAIGDFDRDGDADVASGNDSNSISVLLGHNPPGIGPSPAVPFPQ